LPILSWLHCRIGEKENQWLPSWLPRYRIGSQTMILYNGCHRINQSSIQSMHFAISYGIWIDCCILVCSLNSLCPRKSSASSSWNVNSCLEKKISHSSNKIM
jgi:hypothetical protein